MNLLNQKKPICQVRHTLDSYVVNESRERNLAAFYEMMEELFPRTIVMDEGVIVADGKTKDILDDEKLLEAHGLERP